MRMLRCVMLGALALQSPSVFSQEVWVGRPTVGDYVRRDVHQLLTAFVELQRASVEKEILTQDIVKARKAFFATAANPERRAEVAKQFALLLTKKDLFYFAMYVGLGTDGQGIEVVKAVDVISRGAVDGGIFPEVFREYLAWVNGIRSSLGFSGDSALGGLSGRAVTALQDKAAVAKAFQDSEHLYAKYVEARDRAEIERFNNRRARGQNLASFQAAIEAAQLPDGDRKLHSKNVVLFNVDRHANTSNLGNDLRRRQFSEFLTAAKATGPLQLIECAYGPMTAQENGASWTLVYQTYRFWYRASPKGLEEVVGWKRGTFPPGGGYERSYLSLPIALDECGETRTRTDEAVKQLLAAQRAAPPSQPSAMGARDLRKPSPTDATAVEPETRPADAASEQHARRVADPRQCAASAAQLERERERVQAAPPQLAARYQARLQSLEHAHARRCSG